MMNFRCLIICVFFFVNMGAVLSQTDDDFFMRDDTLSDVEGITKYDAFCPILEGDSVKFCGKNPCTGWIKEYYPNTEKLIHEGSYQYGQIANFFTNYFISGKTERSFVKSANGDFYTFKVFDSIGNPITHIEYFRKIVLKRKDYYPGGILELDEVFDKKGRFVESQKYYYPNGAMYSELILTDSKKNIYLYKEYHKSGGVKVEGQKIRNPELNDYFNHGKWIFYDSNNKIVKEENYSKGSLVD